ncbi:MAG: hypothetical protein ACTSX8_00320 [Alphaproteobacteria bacterium]
MNATIVAVPSTMLATARRAARPLRVPSAAVYRATPKPGDYNRRGILPQHYDFCRPLQNAPTCSLGRPMKLGDYMQAMPDGFSIVGDDGPEPSLDAVEALAKCAPATRTKANKLLSTPRARQLATQGEAALMQLPGIGPKLARLVVALVEQNDLARRATPLRDTDTDRLNRLNGGYQGNGRTSALDDMASGIDPVRPDTVQSFLPAVPYTYRAKDGRFIMGYSPRGIGETLNPWFSSVNDAQTESIPGEIAEVPFRNLAELAPGEDSRSAGSFSDAHLTLAARHAGRERQDRADNLARIHTQFRQLSAINAAAFPIRDLVGWYQVGWQRIQDAHFSGLTARTLMTKREQEMAERGNKSAARCAMLAAMDSRYLFTKAQWEEVNNRATATLVACRAAGIRLSTEKAAEHSASFERWLTRSGLTVQGIDLSPSQPTICAPVKPGGLDDTDGSNMTKAEFDAAWNTGCPAASSPIPGDWGTGN